MANVTPAQRAEHNFAGKASPVNLEGGTSEAAPLTAGVAALVIQAYKQAHGHRPSPAIVQRLGR